MNLDSQKFFIGLMDFFSILLPGALLTWLLMGEGGRVSIQGWVVNCGFAGRFSSPWRAATGRRRERG